MTSFRKNWEIRNNSSNVSNSLNFDQNRSCANFANKPLSASKFLRSPEEPEEASCGCEKCYCQRTPVVSKFNMKGPRCSKISRRTAKSNYSGERPGLKFFDPNEKNERLHYTDSRLTYENLRTQATNTEEQYLEADEERGASEGTDSTKESRQNGEKGSEAKFSSSVLDLGEKLRKVNTFRKENYFDCHSTAIFDEGSEEGHKCLHKFVLDNRLMPQPLNPDAYGTSRCTVCSKPLKSLSKLSEKRTEARPFSAKGGKPTQALNQINIINKSDRTELKIPLDFTNFMGLFGNTVLKLNNPVPSNSIALRYQKGMNY